MLGINTPGDRVPKPFRNYAAVNPGDPAFVALEAAGAVEKTPGVPWSEYDYFRCTEAGKIAAMRSHREIRDSKSKRRYGVFLDVRECFQDLTFKEFLTDPQFAEARGRV
jgi:hypothetical protein